MKKICLKLLGNHNTIKTMRILSKLFNRETFTMCHIEACTLCQLDCRGCRMRRKNYALRGSGYLTHENFVKFLDLNPSIKNIEISNTGEVFLNPDLVEIIKTAFEKEITISIAGGANFNYVTDEQIDALVRYKVRVLTVALDGASQESYSWYRRNGNFDTVIENIKKLNAKKKELKRKLPYLMWQYVILPSNNSVTEIRRAKKIAKDLSMKIFFVKDWDGFVPENKEEIEKETGLSYHDCMQNTRLNKPWVICSQLWQDPQVNWDGKLIGCCSNIDCGDFGIDMFKVPLAQAMKDDVIIKTKQMILGGEKYKESPCFNCWFYKEFVKSGEFPTEKDVTNNPWKKYLFQKILFILFGDK